MNTQNNNSMMEFLGLSKTCRYIYIPEKDINLTVKKQDGLTVIKHVGKTEKQFLIDCNNGWLIDFCYGCMIDNELYECKNGYMSFNETYLNSWSSEYTVYFSRDYKVVEKYYNDYEEDIEEKEEDSAMSYDEFIEKYL